MELTPDLRERICTFVRAGAFDIAAAEASGVPCNTFLDWLATFPDFAAAVIAAQAEARIAAEIKAKESSPATWLRGQRRVATNSTLPAPRPPAAQRPTTRKLPTRQALFAIEYAKDWNGAQAAIRAGYSPKTARAAAHNLLTKVYVQKAIDEAEAQALRHAQASVNP